MTVPDVPVMTDPTWSHSAAQAPMALRSRCSPAPCTWRSRSSKAARQRLRRRGACPLAGTHRWSRRDAAGSIRPLGHPTPVLAVAAGPRMRLHSRILRRVPDGPQEGRRLPSRRVPLPRTGERHRVGWILLHERPSVWTCIGGLAIVVGGLLVLRSPSRMDDVVIGAVSLATCIDRRHRRPRCGRRGRRAADGDLQPLRHDLARDLRHRDLHRRPTASRVVQSVQRRRAPPAPRRRRRPDDSRLRDVEPVPSQGRIRDDDRNLRVLRARSPRPPVSAHSYTATSLKRSKDTVFTVRCDDPSHNNDASEPREHPPCAAPGVGDSPCSTRFRYDLACAQRVGQ